MSFEDIADKISSRHYYNKNCKYDQSNKIMRLVFKYIK